MPIPSIQELNPFYSSLSHREQAGQYASVLGNRFEIKRRSPSSGLLISTAMSTATSPPKQHKLGGYETCWNPRPAPSSEILIKNLLEMLGLRPFNLVYTIELNIFIHPVIPLISSCLKHEIHDHSPFQPPA